MQGGIQVEVIGYDISMPLPSLTSNEHIKIHNIPGV